MNKSNIFASFLSTLWTLSIAALAIAGGYHMSMHAVPILEQLQLPAFLISPLSNSGHAAIITTLLGIISTMLIFFLLG
ncbi:hypothetical protein ACQZV8_20245, partial [Magnetococcales bacterium HHB-1]